MSRTHTLHTYKFVSHDGAVTPARYHFVPEDGDSSIPDEEAATLADSYLREELDERLRTGPAVFHIELEIADETDPLDVEHSRAGAEPGVELLAEVAVGERRPASSSVIDESPSSGTKW